MEGKSNLVQDMKDEGYNFKINPKTLELVASKKKNKLILSSIGSTGNYTLVFIDKIVLTKKKKILQKKSKYFR
ncbi:hypothetical protein [Thomasclavelia sp.]